MNAPHVSQDTALPYKSWSREQLADEALKAKTAVEASLAFQRTEDTQERICLTEMAMTSLKRLNEALDSVNEPKLQEASQ